MNKYATISEFPSDDSVFGPQDILDWFGVSEQETAGLNHLKDKFESVQGDAIDGFYDRVKANRWASAKFESDDRINQVKRAQARYFGQILDANPDEAYFQERRRIGFIHENAGIGPVLYIGAFSYYLDFFARAFVEYNNPGASTDLEPFLAFQKMAHLDMALALETYIERREATITEQQRQISDMPTPILTIDDGLLLIPVVGILDSYRARNLTVDLLDALKTTRATVVVMDITGVHAVDSAVANHLIHTMAAARLMGARAILTGMAPEVAQAMVKIGVSADLLNTAGDLQDGLKQARRYLAQ